MSPLFGRKRRNAEGGDDEMLPLEPDVAPPEETAAIVPSRPEPLSGEIEEWHPDSVSSAEMTPVNVPPSHEEFLIQYRAEIQAYYKMEGWEFTEGGEAEDKLMALWEDFAREVFAEQDTLEEAEASLEMLEYRKNAFLAMDNGVARYTKWLQMATEQKRFERGTLHNVQKPMEPGGMGVDDSKLRERYGHLRRPEDELMSTSPDLLSVVAMMLDDIEKDFDVFFVVYMKSGDPHGGVGGGKSDFTISLMYLLDETYDLRYRTVFYRDSNRMDRLQRNTTPFIAWNWDEGEQWAFLQDWAKGDVKEKGKEWMSRRFLHQKVGVSIPQGRYVAGLFKDRITWSFRILERGVIEVYRGAGWDEEADHFGQERVTILEVGKLNANLRKVYERCKLYAYSNAPGALDKKLELEAGKGRQWPYEELHIEVPEPLQAAAEEGEAAADGGEPSPGDGDEGDEA